MKKTETIEAIDKLIKKYKEANKSRHSYLRNDFGSTANCPLCDLFLEKINGNCPKCINFPFHEKGKGNFPCVDRINNYRLSWEENYVNLVKFWTTVKLFISPLEEEINIEDIKEHILTIAKPFKK